MMLASPDRLELSTSAGTSPRDPGSEKRERHLRNHRVPAAAAWCRRPGHRNLRTRILTGELERGAKLPTERQLAEYYDVSGPTIREALRALSAMGFVEVRHGSGTYVVPDSDGWMSDAMHALVRLEGVGIFEVLELTEAVYAQSVALAVRVATDEEIADLRAAADELKGATGDHRLKLKAFLTSLVGLSHNRLVAAVAGYLIESQLEMATALAGPDGVAWKDVGGSLADYRGAIVDAIEARDLDAGQEAVHGYLEQARQRITAFNHAAG